jgi:hypothetical protein
VGIRDKIEQKLCDICGGGGICPDSDEDIKHCAKLKKYTDIGRSIIIVLTRNNKIGRRAIEMIKELNRSDIVFAYDSTGGILRVIKLVLKRRFKLHWVWQMFWADVFRYNPPRYKLPKIKTKRDLTDLILFHHPVSAMYLFYAGYIIDREILSLIPDVYNIHCASIPKYAGLGALHNAIDNKEHYQEATLHRVTKKIDSGEVVKTKQYELVSRNTSGLFGKNIKKESYRIIEDRAYFTGMMLLQEWLSKS